MKDLTVSEVLNEYTKFTEYIDKYISAPRSTKIKEFFGRREMSLNSSPYSIMKDGIGCYSGGYIQTINRLIEISLVMERVWDKFGKDKKYTTEELVFSVVMCEIGKIGTNEEPFFLLNTNDWEIKNRGIIYKYNPKLPNLKYSDSSLFTLQKEGIQTTENEYMAIKLYGTFGDEDSSHYFKWGNRPKSNLFMIINQARDILNNTNE